MAASASQRDQADRPARLGGDPPAGRDPEQREAALQRFAITLDNQIVSLATIDFRENPEGIDGRTGAQINGIGYLQETQDLAESLRIGALPIELKLISQTQVSATLGQQALDQGLLAGGVGLLADDALPRCVLPRARRGGSRGARDLRGAPVRAGQADPDHAHAAGHRGPDPHARRRGGRQHRHLRAHQGGGAGGQIDPGRDLGRLRQGAANDHRRQRRHDRRRLHPLHARHSGREGVRVHARRRHDRVAVHGRAGHVGHPRLDEPHAADPLAVRDRGAARGRPSARTSTSSASPSTSSRSRA